MSADQDFLDRLLQHTYQLLRAASGSLREHQALLERAHRQIVKLIVAQDDLSAVAQARASVLTALLGRVDKAIKATYKKIATLAQRQLTELAVVESTWAANASRAAIKAPEGIVRAISKEFAENLATKTRVEGNILSEWWEKQTTDTRLRYHRSIRRGFESGMHPREIVKEVNETVLPITKRHVEGVVRTSFMQVSQNAELETYRQNADLYDGVEFVARLDDRTTVQCIAMDGTKWTLDGKPIGGHNIDFISATPPVHFGCVVEGTRVSSSSDLEAVFMRYYEGDVIVVRTASGRELTVTPNHPILTHRGWIAADSVDPFDKIVCDGLGQWEAFGDDDDDDVPSRIEDVAKAFIETRGVRAVPMPVAAEDFHGDGAASHGQIGVVAAYGELGQCLHAAFHQHLRQNVLMRGTATIAAQIHRLCLLDPLFFGRDTPPHGSMRGAGETLDLLGGASLHPRQLLLAAVAQMCATFEQSAGDRPCGHTQAFSYCTNTDTVGVVGNNAFQGRCVESDRTGTIDPGIFEDADDASAAASMLTTELIDSDASAVVVDDIVGIDRLAYKGNVYNLQTATHYYAANGVFTHNCRSRLLPVHKAYERVKRKADAPPAMRRAMDGRRPAKTRFEDLLNEKGEAFQDKMLGPTRAKLYREGKLTLRDLVDTTGQPIRIADLVDD